ncbi:MAG: MarR family winged helix-turn-helix transcriptional regulator [Hyphomonas sp.]
MDLAHDASLDDDLRDLLRFADTVSQAHFRLSEIVGAVHGDRHLANASRGVLRYLMAAGPRTVPEIAKWRATSRQFIQRLVDALAAEGLVILKSNPQHQRSRLVAVTRKGRTRVAEMVAKEVRLLEEGLARSGASLADVRAATNLIHRFIGVIGTLTDEISSGNSE